METTLRADLEQCLGKADATGNALVAARVSSAIDALNEGLREQVDGRNVVVGIYRGVRSRSQFC